MVGIYNICVKALSKPRQDTESIPTVQEKNCQSIFNIRVNKPRVLCLEYITVRHVAQHVPTSHELYM